MDDAGAREAVDRLIASGIVNGGPSGPRRTEITRMRLPRLDAKVPTPRPWKEQVEIEGPLVSADLGTVRFVKEREILGRRLYAISFDMISNPALRAVAAPRPDGSSWRCRIGRAVGGLIWAPASGCPCRRGSSRPTLLSASIGAAAGASVALRGSSVTPAVSAIRLRFPDGATIEADADDDLALFYTESPADLPPDQSFTPELIEVLDGDRVIATQIPRQVLRRRPPPGPLPM